MLAGFIGGNLIHTGVDTALGYADSEIGPWHTRRPTVPINRTQTLLLKMLMTAGISVLTTSMVMLACIAALGMDATHIPLLWIFSYCACLAIGLGVQAINAAFGGIGQLVSMFVFIALALPSSGATVPLQAAARPSTASSAPSSRCANSPAASAPSSTSAHAATPACPAPG